MVINKTTLTIQDAQYLLGSSAYNIYKLIHGGKQYAYKDAGGKMWKIPEQAILDYLNSLKVIYPQK
ncbi:helix-turn-helix domain-containing protein [Megamonas funiformis]|uniref:helix-turn-helix domain-containing protein n=1 Tax=Megamonas funiformis TaxID=437897 RepID=UPI002943DA16|nr:helix-turn-helix domain-containing protein [Megamonas funiformis]